jgi:hypothetical protein
LQQKLSYIAVMVSLALAGWAQSTQPTAQLPIKHAPSSMPAGLATLAATATAGQVCNPSTHVRCAPHSGSGTNYIASGTTLMSAIQAAATTIETGSSVVGEVVVADSGFRYDFSTSSGGPFAFTSGCQGNWLQFDIGCRGRLPVLIQPNPASPLYVLVVGTHYGSGTWPAPGTGISICNGNGYSCPAGEVANTCTGVGVPNPSCTGSDYYTIGTPDGVVAMFAPDHTNGIWFEGMETTSFSNIAHQGRNATELGDGYQLFYESGAGQSGARAFHLTNGALNDWVGAALTVDLGQPIVEGWVQAGGTCGSSTPWTATGNIFIPPGTQKIICLQAYNTHFVNGSTAITFTWNGIDWPASDVAIGNVPGCGLGAVVAPFVCVVDSTHAYIPVTGSLTGTPSSPTYNGGVHNFHLDTGPTWQAGTEHAPSTDAIVITQPQNITVSCGTCPTGGIASPGFVLPNTGSYAVTVQGTTSGPGQTHFDSTYSLAMGIGTGSDVLVSGVSVNVATQTITATVTPETFYHDAPHTLTILGSAKEQGVGYPVPAQEIDVLYKAVAYTDTTSRGIDHCELPGHGIYLTNYGTRGQTYTEDCYGIGQSWTSALNCSGTCGTSIGNFGSDVIINQIQVLGSNHLQIHYTVDSYSLGAGHVDAEEGSKNIVVSHSLIHGKDGTLNNFTGGACTGPGGSCYEINAEGVVSGLVLQAAGGTFIDSICQEVHIAGNVTQDTPCLTAAIGTGPLLVQNNLINPSTEAMLLGGNGRSDANSPVEECDVEVTHNYFWRSPYYLNIGISIAQPGMGSCTSILNGYPKCTMSVKNTGIEGKQGCRVHEWNNVMDHNWVGVVREYYSATVTPRSCCSQGTAAASTQDWTIDHNALLAVFNGFNTEASDVNCAYGLGTALDSGCGQGSMPAVGSHRVVVADNLVVGDQNSTSFGNPGYVAKMFNVLPFLQDWAVTHNTFMPASGVTPDATPATVYFNNSPEGNCAALTRTTYNLWFINNVSGYYGFNADVNCTPNQQSGQTGWMSQPSTPGPNDFSHRACGDSWSTFGYGAFSACNNTTTVPTVTTPVGATNYIVSQIFQGIYSLNGMLPGLANWINPCAPNCQTTDGSSANVSAGLPNWNDFGFITAVVRRSSSTTLRILTTSLPTGQVGTLYNQSLQAINGTLPYTWAIISGSLPGGLTLNPSTGAITGMPSGTGTSGFTVQVTDSSTPTPQTASQPLSISIVAPLVITTTSLPSGQVGVAYSTSMAASGGMLPYTWQVVLSPGQCFPVGLSMSGAGAITGMPTALGTCMFTVAVADSGTPQQIASGPFSITINPFAINGKILVEGIKAMGVALE